MESSIHRRKRDIAREHTHSRMDYGALSKVHGHGHGQLCQSDVLYGLLYGGDDEALLSHVKGLIDGEDTPKPGQVTLLLSPVTEWSMELRDAMALLRTLEHHPLLGQVEQAALRRTTYHAILLACLPHVTTFTSYILDRSRCREGCMRFIRESLIPTEEEFFYGSAEAFTDVESWVNHLRSRYACYA